MNRVSWPVMWFAFAWWFMETSYFGWNAMPGSTTELFADGGVLVLAALAFPRKTVLQITIKGIDTQIYNEVKNAPDT